jgi:hypothetical protein
MRPRYFGPMIVVSRNRGGAYIVCDLDGTLAHAPVAAFRVVPYFARRSIKIPDLEAHLDVSVARLRELERSHTADPDEAEAVAESFPPEDREDHPNDSNSDDDDGDGDGEEAA